MEAGAGIRECREAYASAGSVASADAPGSSRSAAARVRLALRAVHRLQEEVVGTPSPSNRSGSRAFLRVDELELVSRSEHQRRPPPSDSRRSSRCPPGGARCRWSRPRSRIPPRAAPRSAPHRAGAAARRRCRRRTACRWVPRRGHAAVTAAAPARRPSRTCPPPGPVGARRNRCRRTGTPRRSRSCFAAGPQVAPREAAEHRRAARVRAFALQRVEDLLDRVAHACAAWYARGIRHAGLLEALEPEQAGLAPAARGAVRRPGRSRCW